MGLGIHILGASGTGTTTVGQRLARELDCAHFDADDYFWYPTDPPFQEKRPIKERQKLLRKDIKKSENWIISGCICGWGDIFMLDFDLVVFLKVPTSIRLERLQKRQEEEFGLRALQPGGEMHKTHRQFMEWAADYDQGDVQMRSLARHEIWLAHLDCPILKIEGDIPLNNIINKILSKVNSIK